MIISGKAEKKLQIYTSVRYKSRIVVHSSQPQRCYRRIADSGIATIQKF